MKMSLGFVSLCLLLGFDCYCLMHKERWFVYCMLHDICRYDLKRSSIIPKKSYSCTQFRITENSVLWFGSVVSWFISCSTWVRYGILVVYEG